MLQGKQKQEAEDVYTAAEKQELKDGKEEVKQQAKESDNPTDELGQKAKAEKEEADGGESEWLQPKDKKHSVTQKLVGALATKDVEPAGGLDKTPVPDASSGYDIRFTFHKCLNLPVADIGTASSDPFFLASLTSLGIQPRHKEDPEVRLRSRTIRKNVNPEWEQTWVVGGVPKEGFKLKLRIYDEDIANKDDRLGNVTIIVPSLPEPVEGAPRCGWEGIQHGEFKVKKRMGSWRAYALKQATSIFGGDLAANFTVSIEMLGKSVEKGRMYTLGPTTWTQHYSPMIGRIAGVKAPDETEAGKPKVEKYDFQANQLQLRGPVPAALYHRFVEFKPFVRGMFTASGIRGKILNKALHHQHTQIYSYSSTTKYGTLEPETEAVTRRFLEQTHAQEEGVLDAAGKLMGGRLFTYILSLDGLMRFTETGKEFGVDMLSKHTMHADVNVYVACSGEFYLRRKKHANAHAPTGSSEGHEGAPMQQQQQQQQQPGLRKMKSPDSAEMNRDGDGNHNGQGQGRPAGDALASGAGGGGDLHSAMAGVSLSSSSRPGTAAGSGGIDPRDFELIIDNDSGTYRPNKEVMPQLIPWLSRNFPGLKIVFRDCGEEKLQAAKKRQREVKKGGGRDLRVVQRRGSGSSGWSSGRERLERMAGDDGEGEGDGEGWKGKSKRERVVDVVEDPEKVVRGLMDARAK